VKSEDPAISRVKIYPVCLERKEHGPLATSPERPRQDDLSETSVLTAPRLRDLSSTLQGALDLAYDRTNCGVAAAFISDNHGFRIKENPMTLACVNSMASIADLFTRRSVAASTIEDNHLMDSCCC
jgi:hypothetical protein